MPAEILVIGYGNTLRGDDGIGPAVAADVADQGFPGVRVLTVHQLTPDLAADLAGSRRVVFVDAAVAPEPVSAVRLDPVSAEFVMTHAADPGGLLALTRAVFGCSPEAWLVTAAGADFGFREGLTPTGRENARDAAGYVRYLILEAPSA